MLIFISIIGIGFLILVHELGHFLAAKAFGMRAEKFYIGFPPAVVKKRIGETEYGIGFIPLGGYVKISGMTREEEIPEELKSRAYWAKPVWQRIITISAGPAMNLLLAGLFFFIFFYMALPDYRSTNTIDTVQAGSGAEAAGIRPGDRLLEVDGAGNGDPAELRAELRSHPGQIVTLRVERDGQTLNMPASVGINEETSEGRLGIAFDAELAGTRSMPATEALRHTVSDTAFIVKEVFVAIKNLFVQEEARQEITSPIGIVAVSSETISLGWGVYIRVLGFISLQLAIFNLLPLLPLDGGHVLFNIIEKVRGKPIRKEVFEKVSVVGLALFATLFLMGVMNDIQRLMGPGFGIER